MNVDAILARFRTSPDESWRGVAARVGLPYRRVHGWRWRRRIPASGIRCLLKRAADLGVPLTAEDFFPQDERAPAAGPVQGPFVGAASEHGEQACAEEAA